MNPLSGDKFTEANTIVLIECNTAIIWRDDNALLRAKPIAYYIIKTWLKFCVRKNKLTLNIASTKIQFKHNLTLSKQRSYLEECQSNQQVLHYRCNQQEQVE